MVLQGQPDVTSKRFSTFGAAQLFVCLFVFAFFLPHLKSSAFVKLCIDSVVRSMV